MNFHVAWTPKADQQIQHIWSTASADLRDAILVALMRIAADLTTQPNDVGESRSQTRRIAFFLPLVINFDVDVERRKVRIGGVKVVEAKGDGK